MFLAFTHINVNDGRKSAILNLNELTFFRVHPSMESYTLFNNNGLAIWHGFLDITHIRVNNGRKSATMNSVELIFFKAYPSLKPHILFWSNGCIDI